MATKKLAEKRLAVDVAREVIDSLPPDATLAEIRQELTIASLAERGLLAVAEGRVHTEAEAQEIIRSWQF